MTRNRIALAALGLLAAGGLTPAAAQTGNAANGLLNVSANAPTEARVGEQINFDIKLTNVSSEYELRDIELKADSPGHLVIESATVDGRDASGKKGKGKKNKGNQKNNSGQSGNTMTIDSIAPGETKTVSVTASAEKEGRIEACLLVSSYTPAVCLRMNAVKPELDIVKSAPKTARLCEEIVFAYTITNRGSADLEGFTVTDKLPEGLMTIDGNKTLNFSVDGLAAGDARKFEATLQATEPGEYTSRAIAKAQNVELKSRSKQTTTTVQAAQLAAVLEGPNEVYLGEPVTYTIRVSNLGDVTARNTLVAFEYPTNAAIADVSDAAPSDNTVSQDNASGNKKQPKMAKGRTFKSAEERSSAKMVVVDIADEGWDLGDLPAGETREMTVTLKPLDGQAIRPVVIAEADCAIDDGQAAARLTSTGYAVTQIVALPAMLLEAYDNEQKDSFDGNVTYTVRVLNQGDVADQNVKLTAQLPQGVSFVSAEGPTDVTANGQKLDFAAIDSLAPGEQGVWKIMTETEGEGDVRFKVELNTESLTKPATAEEPTRLLGVND